MALSLALTALALIPFGPARCTSSGSRRSLSSPNVDIGLLFVFAITSIGVYGVALAGWSSNSKYSLLGGLRSSAQMISYEVSLTLSVVGVLLLAGTFNFNEIIDAAERLLSCTSFPGGMSFPQIRRLPLLFHCGHRGNKPRRRSILPEAETELVAGFHTEYSSFKFAMFFMAEYANMITVSCLATILFFGGWLSPFPDSWTWQLYLPGVGLAAAGRLPALTTRSRTCVASRRIQLAVVTLLCGRHRRALPAARGDAGDSGAVLVHVKVLAFIFFYVWLRGTLPRFRYDQLMSFGWKLLLPVSLANLVVTAL